MSDKKPQIGIDQIPQGHLNTGLMFMAVVCIGAMACIGGLF